jgi:hypothetical protein
VLKSYFSYLVGRSSICLCSSCFSWMKVTLYAFVIMFRIRWRGAYLFDRDDRSAAPKRLLGLNAICLCSLLVEDPSRIKEVLGCV